MAAHPFDPSYAATAAENYQRYFVPLIGKPLAEDLVGEAALQTGERVLDVGCGTGVVTRLAAERVGPAGLVTGIDINPAMIAVATAATPAEYGIEWRQASADDIPYADGSFDVVLCQLSLQFMPDRAKALREMYRVLAPEGRLMLNVPGPADPIFQTLADAMEHHVNPQAKQFVQTVFALHDTAEIEALLSTAGFRAIDTHAYTRDLALPSSHDFLWQYVESTPLAGVLAGTNDEARSALEREVLAGWAEHEDAGGLAYHQRIVVASAHR